MGGLNTERVSHEGKPRPTNRASSKWIASRKTRQEIPLSEIKSNFPNSSHQSAILDRVKKMIRRRQLSKRDLFANQRMLSGSLEETLGEGVVRNFLPRHRYARRIKLMRRSRRSLQRVGTNRPTVNYRIRNRVSKGFGDYVDKENDAVIYNEGLSKFSEGTHMIRKTLSDNDLHGHNKINTPKTSPCSPSNSKLRKKFQRSFDETLVPTTPNPTPNKFKKIMGFKKSFALETPKLSQSINLPTSKQKQWNFKTSADNALAPRVFRVKPSHINEGLPLLLTEDQLFEEMRKPSDKFHQCQSYSFSEPKIGSMDVEVLRCAGLYRRDRFTNTKPNAVVYMSCGDHAFVTDMIPKCRSPVWLPCLQRAATFPIYHAYARLHVGVFDAVEDRTKNDKFLGKVIVDVPVLRPHTQYTIALPLRESSSVYDRRPRGVIFLRLCLSYQCFRQAALSYVRRFSSHYPEAITIPCADAKTLRNLTVTLYGHDLPGRYNSRVFKALLREVRLYDKLIRYKVKMLALDVMLWRKPLLSIYLFTIWMKCVHDSSIALVPAYVFGFFTILMVRNYFFFARAHEIGNGPTIHELAFCLLGLSLKTNTNSNSKQPFDPFSSPEDSLLSPYCHHHMEFAFSNEAYHPKMRIEEAVKQKKRIKSFDNDLQVLSMHPIERVESDAMDGTTTKEESDEDSFGQEAVADNLIDSSNDDSDDDVDDMDEDDLPEEVHAIPLVVSNSQNSQRPSGPPQDADFYLKGRDIKTHLNMIEDIIHTYTCRIFEQNILKFIFPYSSSKKLCKVHGIDLDVKKKLGLVRPSNPIRAKIMDHLGPIMRVLNVYTMFIRTGVYLATWKDPFLSFWILAFLFLLTLILAMIPWRSLLFVIGFLGFGPQNIIVSRIYNSKKFMDDSSVDNESTVPSEPQPKLSQSSTKSRKIGRVKKIFRDKRQLRNDITEDDSHEICQTPPPDAFCGNFFSSKTPKKTTVAPQPHEIKVPYHMLRRERFYDWPPHPSALHVIVNYKDEDK